MDTDVFDLDCQHSYFPPSSSRLAQNSTLRSLRVSTGQIHDLLNNGALESESFLFRAWAMLLHAYLRQESVCFIILPLLDHTDNCDSWRDHSSFKEPREVTLARCRLSFLSSGGDKSLDFRVCPDSGMQRRKTNTGLVFSVSDSFSTELGKETELPSTVIPQRQSVEHLDLILYIARKQSQMFLLFRDPSISLEFAKSIRATFEHMLEYCVQNKICPSEGLSDLPPQHIRQILAWNPIDPFSLKKAVCLHQLVEEVALRIPEAEAVCAWDGSLDYQTLDVLSSIAGRRLRAWGVKPGVYVPFAYEKSMWTIVACLGILKAGGAFVPLGIHEPSPRLLGILKSINAHVLVTSRQSEAKFRPFIVNVVVIDATTIGTGRPCFDNYKEHSNSLRTDHSEANKVSLEVQPTDPVFVLFTSGSTGQPKGMIHDHQSISTQWLLQGKVLGYDSARVLQFAAHTFDVFIIDVFTALLYGGCVCVPSEEDRQNNVVSVINEMKANYAILTPSFAGLIHPSEVPTLKTLAIGGEALPQDRVQRWAERVRLIQIYGPAEVGICLAVDMKPDTPPETVGYPLTNCSCWLVDPMDSDYLVPIGAVGELIVAGPSLALGYFSDEAKTQACFINAPSWAQTVGLPFSRFYKTGDLLRLNTKRFDGSFDFVGRKDSQIKLRGQRLEPGEVEYHLGKLHGVAHAMVTKPVDGPYAEQLVAVVQTRVDQGYFQKQSHFQISISAQPKLSLAIVRDKLSGLMPSSMVPAVYLEVEALPCVPSMKIDRRLVQGWLNGLKSEPSLALVERFPIILEQGTVWPLGQAVSNLLVQKLGRNFATRDFVLQDTGIDSIQIISLAMFIRKEFGVKVPVTTLLDPATTISSLAHFVDTHTGKRANSHILHSNGETRGSFNLIHEVKNLHQRLKDSLYRTATVSAIPAVYSKHYQPHNVLLTGATGFLGIAILHSLLKHHPNTKIYALIRCPSEHEGLLRLIQSLDSQNRWEPAYLSRLYVIPSDLNAENLGLSPQTLSMLQLSPAAQPQDPSWSTAAKPVQIDTIIHAAAKVHYSTSYLALKQTNTLSVLFLLEAFAAAPSMRRFVYVSGGEHPHISGSLDDPLYVKRIEGEANGYTQSKVVGEQLMHAAALDRDLQARGKSVWTMKPGYIIGDGKTGEANQSDFLWRLIRGCLEIGAYDREAVGKWVFVSDVEYIADRVIGTLAICDGEDCAGDVGNRVERVLHGLWFEDIWRILKDECGYALDALGTDPWMNKLTQVVEKGGETHLLFPLLDILEREGRSVGVNWQSTSLNDGEGRAQQAMRRNIAHLIEVGFLPVPGACGTKPVD